jgi:hypothetical protein
LVYFPSAVNCRVLPDAIVAELGVTVITSKTDIVTLAVPDISSEVATTVPVPVAVAVKSPVESIVPIPPVTDQMGVIGTTLLLASLPVAVNGCVPPNGTVLGLGVTAIVARAPAVPVALKVIEDPRAVAVTLFSPAVLPNVRTVEAFPSVPVVAEVADRDPFPAVMANVTLIPLTGFSLESLAITTKGLGSVAPTVAL